jgi:GNAT superfamily N-acetyltransferase
VTHADSHAPAVTFREVTPANWDDLVLLFEGRGGPKHCWCLVWRERGAASRLDLAGRREAMAGRVRAGTSIGLLAYLGGAPVGWCSVAPRESYRALGGTAHPEGTRVWSLVCFFVQRRLRRRGVSRALLDAAIEAARTHGAHVLEAFPVDPDSPSFRFGGYVPLFERAGFTARGRAGTRRHVMELRLALAP